MTRTPTKDIIPFDDCKTDEIKYNLMFVPIRNNKEEKRKYRPEELEEKMHWNVIDPQNGISYKAPFKNANEIFEEYKGKYGNSYDNYVIFRKGVPKVYYNDFFLSTMV